VGLRTGDTLYLRLGDGPFVVASLVLVLLGWRRSRTGSRARRR
jgi:apolipoprotein N-acyltransferase